MFICGLRGGDLSTVHPDKAFHKDLISAQRRLRCDHQAATMTGEEQRCALRSKVKNRAVNTVSRYLESLCKTYANQRCLAKILKATQQYKEPQFQVDSLHSNAHLA